MNKTYTGVGSRKIPDWMYSIVFDISAFLASEGYTLYSGGAEGSDEAFEKGCDSINGKKQIFLPWNRFNDNKSTYVVSNPKAFKLGEFYFNMMEKINWVYTKQSVKKLMARNVHQVLGWDLNSKTEFLLCYTKHGRGTGGTQMAITIAKFNDIPVFDFGLYYSKREAVLGFYNFYTKLSNYEKEKLKW